MKMVDRCVNCHRSPPTTHISHRFKDTARFSLTHMLVVFETWKSMTLCVHWDFVIANRIRQLPTGQKCRWSWQCLQIRPHSSERLYTWGLIYDQSIRLGNRCESWWWRTWWRSWWRSCGIDLTKSVPPNQDRYVCWKEANLYQLT